VPNFVPTRKISERPFDGIRLRVAIPLRDRDGAVPCDAGQRKRIADGGEIQPTPPRALLQAFLQGLQKESLNDPLHLYLQNHLQEKGGPATLARQPLRKKIRRKIRARTLRPPF
jgi:hypothetical protein